MPLILEDIKNKLRISIEDTLLDVGCGLGFFNSIKLFVKMLLVLIIKISSTN